MNIKILVKIFILLILVDLIWLKLIAEKKYRNMIKNIQGVDMKVQILPALSVYFLMAILLILFGSTDIRNFILGFCTYGVYDMTNLAIFNKFDAKFAIADMIWGGILFTVTYRLNKII